MCKIVFQTSCCDVQLSGVAKVFSKLPTPSILGGIDSDLASAHYSYFAANPTEIFTLDTNDTAHFNKIQRVVSKFKISENPLPNGMFAGGWIGYFSYDIGNYIEKVAPSAVDDLEMPLVRLCFYDKFICYDHAERVFYFVALEIGDGISAEEKIESLKGLLEESKSETISDFNQRTADKIDSEDFDTNMSKDYYFDSFGKIKKYIYDGDVYQINFSQRFCFDFKASAIDLYLWQNKFNPSPYAAYIDSGDFKIVSASPELFIQTDGRKIKTSPIKGTCKRTCDEKIDAQLCEKLFNSAKEKAELDMIIDLERNDFGRICKYGSIKVTQRRVLEDYATVTHAVATIEGQLREEIDFAAILKAIFPGGSITGAPKVAAMQMIEDLEPTKRGLYTGSIGYIDVVGNVCLNIAIRTIIIKAFKAYTQAGGGIVADSEVMAEWEETLAKAAALLKGIKAVSCC